MVERETGMPLKCLRTDNGGEYISREFRDYCQKHGIRHEKTVPGTPQHNGVAERMNRTIVERVRSMLKMANLPKSFWGEAVGTAVYLINRLPSVPLAFDTPEKVWTGKDAGYSHLRVFGCKAFMHVLKEQRLKLDDKSVPCTFVGYGDEEFGYRLWDPVKKKIVRSRDVVFHENEIMGKTTVDDVSSTSDGVIDLTPVSIPTDGATGDGMPQSEQEDEEPVIGDQEMNVDDVEDAEQGEPENPNPTEGVEPQLRRSTRERQPSTSFPDGKNFDESKLIQSMDAAFGGKLDMGTLSDGTTSKKKLLSNAEIQHSLRQEILKLEKRLQDQVSVRCALEKSLGYRGSSRDISVEAAIPKPATQLIKEISVLEIEVGHLEQYLLSLYRKAFDQQVAFPSPSRKDEGFESPLVTPRRRRLDFSKSDVTPSREFKLAAENPTSSNLTKEANGLSEEKLVDSGVQHCHFSLSQRSTIANRTSPSSDALGKAVRACHSQPLAMMEYAQNSSSRVISLAEHLGTCISDHIIETPNRISEDMVKCMSSIYCKLADPPVANHGLSSPASSLSSASAFSPKDHNNLWSPGFRNDSSFDVRLDNPFHVEGLKDFSVPYSSMIEVNRIYRDSKKLGDVDFLLQNFRSLISRLEEIDPKKMTHEEKLAFWINVHNALVMHAFLAYGVPQNNMKRMFILLKTAYNVGGKIVSADVIRSSILGCRLSRPGQWLRLLLLSKTKLKAGDERQAYGIERPEPLLYFALSSGSHSDPAVRIFTAKRVFEELEAAKEDYVRATFGVGRDGKILLPKLIESFGKDSGLQHGDMLEMIQHCLPESLRKSIKKCQQKQQQTRTRKNIEWGPHIFSFRYLILKEAGDQLNI